MFYFHNMLECIELAEKAVNMLLDCVTNFDPDSLPEKFKEMHLVEQAGDTKKHEMIKVVSEAFITPIEREDIVEISNILDDIIDDVEDILIQIYVCNVRELRYDIVPEVENLKNCIISLKDVISEFPNFRKSNTLHDLVIKVNDYEEQGDKWFMDSMVRLYREDSIEPVVRWMNIYQCIENTMDKCEDAADTVQTVVMKNL